MEIIGRELPADCTIVDSGDLHIGSANCHKHAIRDMLRRIGEDDSCFAWFKGDLIEAITPNDKRYAHCGIDKESMTAQAQVEEISRLLFPIKERILGVSLGNHEYKLINVIDIAWEVAQKLNVPYGGVTWVFKSLSGASKHHWKAFLTHGAATMPQGAKDPIQRDANRKAWLKRRLERAMFSDCILASQGHTHVGYVVAPTIDMEVILVEKNGSIKQTRRVYSDQSAAFIPPEARWYLNSPSFLKLYTPPNSRAISYGEMAMLGPTELGWLEIDIRDHLIVGVRKVVA